MRAANKGAFEAGGRSIGLNVEFPHEQGPNPHQTDSVSFRDLLVRRVMLVEYASASIVFPGGFGTLDELFESLTIIQTLKIHPFSAFLVGRTFWGRLVDPVRNTLAGQGTISPADLDLFRVVDDVDGIPATVEAYHRRPDHAGFYLPSDG